MVKFGSQSNSHTIGTGAGARGNPPFPCLFPVVVLAIILAQSDHVPLCNSANASLVLLGVTLVLWCIQLPSFVWHSSS
jgi:hypothetical protein